MQGTLGGGGKKKKQKTKVFKWALMNTRKSREPTSLTSGKLH